MDLNEIFLREEDTEFELKEKIPRDFVNDLVAFSNAEGGKIVIGVSDNRKICGIEDVGKLKAQLYGAANYVNPPVIIEISIEMVENKEIAIVKVPKGLHGVYSCGGKFFVRRKGQSIPLVSRDEMLSLMIERGQTSYGAMPILFDEHIKNVQLSEIKIKDFIKRTKINANPGSLSESEIWDICRNLRGLTKNSQNRDIPTNAGLLLFSDNPQEIIPQSMIKIVRFKGNDTSIPIDIANLKGSLPEIIEAALSFIKRNTSTKITFKEFKRIEKTEYPILCLREVITNAVAHRNYSIKQQNIRMFIFDDRIEIKTPGGLPPPVNLENITKTQYSREPEICRLLIRLGYMDELGSGVARMIKIAKDWGLKNPLLEENESDFIVTLYNQQIEEDKSTHLNGSLIRETDLSNLLPQQILALKFVAENSRINRQQYIDITKSPPATASRHLANLVREGFLKEMGIGKNTYYVMDSK